MSTFNLSNDDLREGLKIAVDALERIQNSDSGPAYYIAKKALEELLQLELDGGDLESHRYF